MEWYRGDGVLKDHSQRTRFPLQERWKQWGDSHSNLPYKLGNSATFEAGFSCEGLMGNVATVCQRNQADISCVQVDGVSEESSLYWSMLLNNQDYQPNGLSGTYQTNKNFMNSFLVDANEHFHFYSSPRTYGSFSTGNNLTSVMVLHSSSDLYNMNHMSSYGHLNAEDFPHSQQSDAPSYNCSDMMTNTISRYSTSVINNKAPPQQACSSKRVGDQPSVEETVLQELGSATRKMTEESRLCFRDALYRLASNSEKYSMNRAKHGDRCPSEMPSATAPPDQTLRLRVSEACESRSNTIDRAVAELMFNKAYMNDKSHQDLVSSAKPCSTNTLSKSLAPHFQHFSGPSPEDALVPTLGQGEAQYLEY